MELSNKDKWYPSIDSGGQVVGRFKYINVLDMPKSREADEHIYKQAIGIEMRVIGSGDESFHVLKPHNEKEYRMRFPEAWKAFRGDEAPIVGTPLVEMGFDAEQIVMLQIQGISSVEQLAGASDAVCQSLGFGWRAKRDKAKTVLAAKLNEVRRAEPIRVAAGPSTEDLMAQIAALSAQVAALTGGGDRPLPDDDVPPAGAEEAGALASGEPASGAPRRRGRPPRAAVAA